MTLSLALALVIVAGFGCGGGGGGGVDGGVTARPVVISTATRTPRTGSWSVNYWMWSPTYGDDLPGTETLVAAVAPTFIRVGGYNNDANTPDTFDDAQLDQAIGYARAIGAQPIIQVPLLWADSTGTPATAATAAAMVSYANVTQGYGVKYFSVGNEPDIYAVQGARLDSTQPAIPGYTPADYCASLQAYVAEMKSVDPTIQIVGPDLAYKYQTGDDWLTPILQGCGELIDVVSIHRYPFSSALSLLSFADSDALSFRQSMTSVRALMQAAGYGDKPLALTEMNIAYDETLPGAAQDASPGTVPSALWLADAVGSGLQLGLWTSALWDISDPDDWSLGMIGLPPAHTPRPEYYAYALYADHFGPTLVDVTAAPAAVSAYASRNAADDATEVMVINWNAAPAPLGFQVTGLAKTPAAPIFVLPALSLAAVEIRDDGTATAWSYGDAQHQAGAGAEPLAPTKGTIGGVDAGTEGGVAADGSSPAPTCPQIILPSAAITTAGTTTGSNLTYGQAPDAWGSYTYAASGQPPPTAAVTPDGNGIQISAAFVSPVLAGNNYAGAGLYFSSASCIDASAYTGVQFDLAGDLGSCTLSFGASFSGDASDVDDPTRGGCMGPSSICYGPAATVVPTTTTTTTIRVPFSSLSGGMPHGALDPATIVSVQWQLSAPAAAAPDAGACAATFTVENAAFY